MCGLSVYEIITDNRTYFSNDWNTTISDGFAIYTPIFVVWLNVWIIICIIYMASVYLIDGMRDAIRFEKALPNLWCATYSKRKNSRNRS